MDDGRPNSRWDYGRLLRGMALKPTSVLGAEARGGLSNPVRS